MPRRRRTKSLSKRNDKVIEYDNLVIEGGGVLGIAYLGALKELYADGTIAKAKSFAGSSVGSLVAAILAVRISYEKLEEIMKNLNLKEYKDRTWLGEDIYRIFKRYGFYKGDKLLSFLTSTLKEITGDGDITFRQVNERYGTNLVITGTNISKGMIVYFSKENYPDMKIALATRISASVPYFFQSVLFDGSYFVDGGVLDNYPISCFDKKGDQGAVNLRTLGLKLISDSDINEEKGVMIPITGIKSFTENLIDTIMNQVMKIHIKDDDWKRTVRIYTGNLSFLNFDLTEEEEAFLINEGTKAIMLFKEQVPAPL